MGFFTDSEEELASKGFKKYLRYYSESSEYKVKKFTEAFRLAYNHARHKETVLHIGEVTIRLGKLASKEIASDEEINLLGYCIGTLVGIFQFQPKKPLENPHIFVTCIKILMSNKQYEGFLKMIVIIVNLWKRYMLENRAQLTAEEKNRFQEFVKSEY